MHPADRCSVQEIEWLSRYVHESQTRETPSSISAGLVAQFITLPYLEPFSNAFVRHACLLVPSLHDVEKHVRCAHKGDMIRFAFSISAVHELRGQAHDVWTEAAAAWSHVSSVE